MRAGRRTSENYAAARSCPAAGATTGVAPDVCVMIAGGGRKSDRSQIGLTRTTVAGVARWINRVCHCGIVRTRSTGHTRTFSHLSSPPPVGTVSLSIIPIDTEIPSRYGASFDLLEFTGHDTPATVVVELEASEYREDDPARVGRYRRRHHIYRDAALDPEESRQLADDTHAQIFNSTGHTSD